MQEDLQAHIAATVDALEEAKKKPLWKRIFLYVFAFIATMSVLALIFKARSDVLRKKQRARELEAQTVIALQTVREERDVERQQRMAQRLIQHRESIQAINARLDEDLAELSSSEDRIRAARSWAELADASG